MVQGFKSFNGSETIHQHGGSAHPVLQVERPGKNQTTTEWFVKELESVQEAQVECMTGEIYRYLIGPATPRIRLSQANTVASEAVNFYSVRDIIENREKQRSFDNFKAAFCADIKGLMMVLFSSIFFEENDLSANNYGLVITDGRFRIKTFGAFTKIDHGQSFNTLRIIEENRLAGQTRNLREKIKKKNMGKAEIKYFPPILPVPDRDFRSKENGGRRKIGIVRGGSRRYEITYPFLDRILLDFLDGRIDKAYIRNLTYQPSIMPFYDNRLLSILKDLGQNAHEELEKAKYWALSKIIFTSEVAYLHIARESTNTRFNTEVRNFWRQIKAKIRRNRNTLRVEMANDPDWLIFCDKNYTAIEGQIQEAWDLMIFKRNRRPPELSGRYGGGRTINPFDRVAFAPARQLGGEFRAPRVLQRTRELIRDIRGFIETTAWETRGRTRITIRGRRIKVPATVGAIYDHILLYEKCPTRIMRAVASIALAVDTASRRRSRSRHQTTTLAYQDILDMAKEFKQDIQDFGVSDEAAALLHLDRIT